MGNVTDNKFNCFIPIEFEKAKSNKPEDKYKNMVFWSMASDNSEDSDGETLEPSGYDIKSFIDRGLINLEHFTTRKGDSKYWIGEPIDAKVKNNKLFIKGKLWEKHPLAQSFWDTIQYMKESGSTRKPGMSIEGTVIERDPVNPKRVTKARINHAAVTMAPKNKNSWLDIVKGEYEDLYVENAPDIKANGGTEYILDFTRDDGTRIRIDKNFNIKVDKAMSAGTETGTDLTGKDTNGAALKKESLKKKMINLQPDFIKSLQVIRKNKEKFSEKSLNIIKNRIKSFLSA